MKILIVDDSITDRLIIQNMLSDYETFVAEDGEKAMEILYHQSIDLMILDLNMPKMNGFEVLTALKQNKKFLGVRTIILTNADEIENEIKGLKLGAVDYIRKPLNIESLRIRIDIHLRLKKAQTLMEMDNVRLDTMVSERTNELVITRNITINALVGLLEIRNFESSKHTARTQIMMGILCNHMKTLPQYANLMTQDCIEELVMTTPLHDIGKVGIPDHILLKPGKLTTEEYALMKEHVIYGVDALKKELPEKNGVPTFIQTAMDVVGAHHEKFDGSGYPYGLIGDNIPLAGRLMAIIDVYDALISRRVYKEAFSHETAIEMIQAEAGKHFDPDLVEIFADIEETLWDAIKDHME
ncbi:response regulator [Vallitaleaceae bacterium 9-2]